MYDKVAELMKKNGLRIADVARATGVSYSTFTDWKAGRYVPKYDKLQKIADFFGVSVDYLLSKKTDTADNAVQISEHPEVYYLDDNAREIAEFYHKNPEYRVLLDASRRISPEDIDFVRQFLEKFGGDE